MIHEPFAGGSSCLHRLDPRVRVVMATAFSFTVALSGQRCALLSALLLAFLTLLLARLNLKAVLKRLAMVNGFIALLWLVLPISFTGPAALHIGPLAVSRDGLALALQITLKSNAIVMVLIALLATMPLVTLGHALGRMAVPPKLVQLLLLTYRYLFVIEAEFARLLRSARIRGFKPGSNLHTYKTYAYLMGMLLVRAADRAQRVHQAMLCRGFNGRFRSIHQFNLTRRDGIGSAVAAAAVLGLAILELMPITP